MIGVKLADKVVLASDTQLTSGGVIKLGVLESSHKIWHPNDYDDLIMGSCGSVREYCLVKTSDTLFDELTYHKGDIDFKYIVNDLIENMRDAIKDEPGKEDDKKGLKNSYLLAVKDKLYQIYNDGAVVEIDEYTAIGSGSNEAIASLMSTTDLDLEERIEKAMIAGSKNDLHVSFPVIIKSTDSKNFRIIEKMER